MAGSFFASLADPSDMQNLDPLLCPPLLLLPPDFIDVYYFFFSFSSTFPLHPLCIVNLPSPSLLFCFTCLGHFATDTFVSPSQLVVPRILTYIISQDHYACMVPAAGLDPCYLTSRCLGYPPPPSLAPPAGLLRCLRFLSLLSFFLCCVGLTVSFSLRVSGF